MAMAGWRRFWHGTLGLLGRPARRAQGRGRRGGGGLVLQPYRGYGNRSEVFVIGRLFKQGPPAEDAGPLRRQLRDIGRRITRRAVAGAEVTARFRGGETTARTDDDGYFRVHLRPARPPTADALWHWMDLSVRAPQPAAARAEVFIPPRQAGVVVVSDIDDTIMFTGVANKLAMLWRLFVRPADDREAFPGVAAFYQALHKGPGPGVQNNPILYVSRGPWGIYDVLDAFFTAHRIPVGPILFLREWGVRWTSPLPRKAVDHKEDLIEHMLDLYDDLPFVLIGDSGQHDPEVYRRVVDRHPGRVRAVYIRDVSRRHRRAEEIRAMAEAVVDSGASLVLAADSAAMADHAAELGLISPAAATDVRSAGTGVAWPTRLERLGAGREARDRPEATEAAAGEAERSLRVERRSRRGAP